jgi:pseudouridine-5'-phosphate glycosidase
MDSLNPLLSLHPELREALAARKPVVALESTLIAHGMPYPQNLETARRLERSIRQEGAVPATIALMDGKICIGLEEAQLHRLARSREAAKASRRDLGLLLARKEIGATTVSATMICAALAGIRFFATGGIGGVHRGASQTFDISADLQELARTPVAVVSAGAKAILDLGLTLEYLETMGVPVITVGQDDFPAFYSRNSKLPSPARAEDPAEIAEILRLHWALGLQSGALIALPAPEAFDIPYERLEPLIAQALQEAEAAQVQGKKLTPFLLQRIHQMSGGESVESNIALAAHNASLAARVAKCFSET